MVTCHAQKHGGQVDLDSAKGGVLMPAAGLYRWTYRQSQKFEENLLTIRSYGYRVLPFRTG